MRVSFGPAKPYHPPRVVRIRTALRSDRSCPNIVAMGWPGAVDAGQLAAGDWNWTSPFHRQPSVVLNSNRESTFSFVSKRPSCQLAFLRLPSSLLTIATPVG